MTNRNTSAIMFSVDAAMAQLVEHILGKDEVISSTLISSSRKASGVPGAFSVFPGRGSAGAPPRTLPRKLFEKSFLGSFKNFYPRSMGKFL